MSTSTFTPTPPDVLRASLERHNATFEALLNLIPARFYLIKEETEEQAASRYQKHKKQKAPKQAVKEASKKAKREKLDPANHKTVLELQAEALATHADPAPAPTPSAKGKGKAKAPAPAAATESDEDDVNDLDADMDADAPLASGSDLDEDDDAEDADDGVSAPLVPMAAASDVSALRAKLHARMATLRRGGAPASRDELLDERRAARAAMRERRRKETREKIRRQEEARGKGKKPAGARGAAQGNATQTQLIVPDAPPENGARGKFTNVSFSAVRAPGVGGGAPPKRPHAKAIATATNPAQALAQLAAKRARLDALPADRREAAEARDTWAKAEARMEGTKIRDDEGRLKKAAKRAEKEKVRSKKQWDERKEQLGASMAAKQKKRTDNIAMRHEKRKDPKSGKGAKGGPKTKGKGRPGFEGKTFGGGKKKDAKK